jgi:hypothetical protein
LAGEKLFFFRQMYSDDAFFPDTLDTSCYCDTVFNPDKAFIQCKECKELIHVECFMNSETQKCSKCNNNIANQLNTGVPASSNISANVAEREPTQFLKMKRQHSDDLPLNPRHGDKKVEPEEKKHEEPKGGGSYPNLSEERRKYLIKLIERVEKENTTMENKNMTPEERSRKIIRDKISYSLLYGIEELKESGDWKKMKVPELAKENIPESKAVRLSKDLAVAIESAIYFQNDRSIV